MHVRPCRNRMFGFQSALFNIQSRLQDRYVAEIKPAVPGSPDALDKVGSTLYESTLRYIEKEAGVGFDQLIAPKVTFGPYPTTYNKQQCWLCKVTGKVTLHVPGNNGNLCILVYEEPVVGPGHVIGSEIDF
jgi:hypothetical protein